MALRRISITNKTLARGFTLIELLIVIGLIALIGGAILFIDLNNYRGDAFRAERTSVVTLLGQARADALNNVLEEPHGLAFFPADYPDSYVLFLGDSYAASDPATRVPYKAAYATTFSPSSPHEVVFEQLNGDASFSGTITMVDAERNFSYDIVLNSEGGISW
jgi:prepilin-type N-terminal cleavage/methylation domain-containing protein